jgi:RNA polymerase sigma-70 factor (ECF subfamily)
LVDDRQVTEPHGATPLSLLERARARQPEAWRQLMGLYQPLVLYWCGRHGLSTHDAEDMSQEVFASAAAHLAEFRRDRPDDTFRGWLRVIARNQCAMHYRRESGKVRAAGGDADAVLQSIPDATQLPEVDEVAEVSQLYPRALELVRSEFEPRTWEMFWLTVVEDRDTADVGEQLGVTAAAVRQAKSRILRRIKEEVGDVM